MDLDGVSVSSPINLNGGTIKDAAGNNATLTFSLPNTSGIKVDYPSLSMDFANSDYILNGTHYATLPSFLTAAGGSFTRASIGTYYDSSGVLQTASSGVPRFDYDPVTHVAKGILIKESRTNLFVNSNEFSIVYNPYGFSITNDAGLAPDGTATADLVTSGTSTPFNFNTNTGGTSATQYVQSIFIKPISLSDGSISIYVGDGSSTCGRYANFTISSQAVVAADSSSTYTALGNGWYRLLMPYTATCTFGAMRYTFYGTSLTSGSRFLVWGRQAEVGAFATSFIPTTAATVTRQADTLIMPTGGWYNSSVGTLLSRSIIPNLGGASYPGIVSFDDGTSNNAIKLSVVDATTDAKAADIFLSGSNEFSLNAAAYTAGAILAQGIAFAQNDTIASMDGVLGPLDTAVNIPTANTFRVGVSRGGYNPINGQVKKVEYYPRRVINTQLQLLTQ